MMAAVTSARRVAILLWLVIAGGSPASRATTLPLELVADVPLPGGAARFDYQWVDPAARRLYIAHLGADSVIVFDVAQNRVLRQIDGLPSVHGVVGAPDRHLIFATATGDKQLAIIDDRTFAIRARVAAGEYPNGLAYDPRT